MECGRVELRLSNFWKAEALFRIITEQIAFKPVILRFHEPAGFSPGFRGESWVVRSGLGSILDMLRMRWIQHRGGRHTYLRKGIGSDGTTLRDKKNTIDPNPKSVLAVTLHSKFTFSERHCAVDRAMPSDTCSGKAFRRTNTLSLFNTLYVRVRTTVLRSGCRVPGDDTDWKARFYRARARRINAP